jgi:hypothetical protein
MLDNQVEQNTEIETINRESRLSYKVNPETVRERIYERLDTRPQPAQYAGKIPWIVQQQSRTNGIHFSIPLAPSQNIPLRNTGSQHQSQVAPLNIGNGWGRWLWQLPIRIIFR